MKVLQIYKDYYPPVMGGIEGHINLLSHGLKERGIEVGVLVSNTRACLERGDVNVRQARFGKLYEPFLMKFLKKAQTIIATSPHYVASSKVLRRFRLKCRVIPLGVDLGRFSPQREETFQVEALRRRYGPRIVLFVGKFRYYKGLHVLIEAMKRVEGRLLLVGAGPVECGVRRQVTEAALDGKVVFLGELPDHHVVAHLQVCDVFVLPAILRSEAFGVVLLEAMACGKPVVSTELATGTSFVNRHEETGLVVLPNDAAALAEAISYLLAHPEIRQRYGQAGRERVERHFSAEGMVDRILEAYSGGRVPRGTAAKGLPWRIHEAKTRSPFDPSSRMTTSS